MKMIWVISITMFILALPWINDDPKKKKWTIIAICAAIAALASSYATWLMRG